VPLAVIAEIRSRLRIVGFVLLHAVGDIVATTRRYSNGAVIVVPIIVIVRCIAITTITVAVALRCDRTSD
jgi:hypothetical protein